MSRNQPRAWSFFRSAGVEPHAERPVGQADLEARHELAVGQGPLLEIRSKFRAFLARLVVVGDDLAVELLPLGLLVDRAGERLGTEAARGTRAEELVRLVREELLHEFPGRLGGSPGPSATSPSRSPTRPSGRRPGNGRGSCPR